MTVPYGAETTGTVTIDGNGPAIVQVRPKSFTAEETGGTAEVRKVDIAVEEKACRVKMLETVEQAAEGPNLEEASIIISGGRGLGKAENFAQLEAWQKSLERQSAPAAP